MYNKLRGRECLRWIAHPLFFIIILLCSVCNFMDVRSSSMFVSFLESGTLSSEAVCYYTYRDSFLWLVGLCLSTLTGATLYAQDFEENAVYMRVQRMGKRKYIVSRVGQTVVSSFLCGSLSFLICLGVMVCYYNIPLLPAKGADVSSYSGSTFLLAGNGYLYLFMRAVQAGFCYMFYALAALDISVFIPQRKVVVAVPMIFWYFNQFLLPWVAFVPDVINPSILFANNYSLAELLGISDGLGLLILTGMMMVLVILSILLFYLRLGKHGIFGGEQE